MKQVAVIFSCGVPPNVIPSFLTKTGTVGEYLIIYQPSLLQLLGVFLYLQASEGKAAEVPRPSLRLGLSGFGSMRSPAAGAQGRARYCPGTGDWPGARIPALFTAPRPLQRPDPPLGPKRPSPLGTWAQEWLGGRSLPFGGPGGPQPIN